MPKTLAPDAVDAGVKPATRTFRPRLVPTLAALAVIAVCVAAGRWQQGRMEQKAALRAEIEAAARAEPLALDALPANRDWTALRYRPVRASGRYLPGRQILVDNKVVAGRAGYDVVTPLALDGGGVVLVDRGWVALAGSRSTLPDVPPPPGEVTVSGRLVLPSARYFELKSDAVPGPVWQHLDPARFAAATGVDVLPVAIEQTGAPVPDDGLVRAWPSPDLGIDTHRIYMVQWYSFAALALGLWLWFGRPRAARDDD